MLSSCNACTKIALLTLNKGQEDGIRFARAWSLRISEGDTSTGYHQRKGLSSPLCNIYAAHHHAVGSSGGIAQAHPLDIVTGIPLPPT